MVYLEFYSNIINNKRFSIEGISFLSIEVGGAEVICVEDTKSRLCIRTEISCPLCCYNDSFIHSAGHCQLSGEKRGTARLPLLRCHKTVCEG